MLKDPTQLIRRFLRIPRLLTTRVINPRAPKPIRIPSSPLPIIRKRPREIAPHIDTTFNRIRHGTQISLKKLSAELVVQRCRGRRIPVVFALCGGPVFGYVDGYAVA